MVQLLLSLIGCIHLVSSQGPSTVICLNLFTSCLPDRSAFIYLFIYLLTHLPIFCGTKVAAGTCGSTRQLRTLALTGPVLKSCNPCELFFVPETCSFQPPYRASSASLRLSQGLPGASPYRATAIRKLLK